MILVSNKVVTLLMTITNGIQGPTDTRKKCFYVTTERKLRVDLTTSWSQLVCLILSLDYNQVKQNTLWRVRVDDVCNVCKTSANTKIQPTAGFIYNIKGLSYMTIKWGKNT